MRRDMDAAASRAAATGSNASPASREAASARRSVRSASSLLFVESATRSAAAFCFCVQISASRSTEATRRVTGDPDAASAAAVASDAWKNAEANADDASRSSCGKKGGKELSVRRRGAGERLARSYRESHRAPARRPRARSWPRKRRGGRTCVASPCVRRYRPRPRPRLCPAGLGGLRFSQTWECFWTDASSSRACRAACAGTWRPSHEMWGIERLAFESRRAGIRARRCGASGEREGRSFFPLLLTFDGSKINLTVRRAI